MYAHVVHEGEPKDEDLRLKVRSALETPEAI